MVAVRESWEAVNKRRRSDVRNVVWEMRERENGRQVSPTFKSSIPEGLASAGAANPKLRKMIMRARARILASRQYKNKAEAIRAGDGHERGPVAYNIRAKSLERMASGRQSKIPAHFTKMSSPAALPSRARALPLSLRVPPCRAHQRRSRSGAIQGREAAKTPRQSCPNSQSPSSEIASASKDYGLSSI